MTHHPKGNWYKLDIESKDMLWIFLPVINTISATYLLTFNGWMDDKYKKEYLNNFFKPKIKNDSKVKNCIKCGSNKIDKGYWTRGWNEACSQACGDNGCRCFDCGHIHWNQSKEDYQSKLPKWCRAYND